MSFTLMLNDAPYSERSISQDAEWQPIGAGVHVRALADHVVLQTLGGVAFLNEELILQGKQVHLPTYCTIEVEEGRYLLKPAN